MDRREDADPGRTPAGPGSRLLVGDDVVDTGRDRTRGRSRDDRLLDRVLTGPERAAVADAEDGDAVLWSLWACKEAAFKIHSKARGEPPPFVHRDYRVTLDDPELDPSAPPVSGPTASRGRRGARIRWADGSARAVVRRGEGWVHAVAWLDAPGHPDPVRTVRAGLGALDDPGAPWAGTLPDLLERLTPEEADPVHSRASAAVRLAARRELAAALGAGEERVAVVCAPGPTGRRPPAARLDGRACPADVSFTHDGRWIAWSVSSPGG